MQPPVSWKSVGLVGLYLPRSHDSPASYKVPRHIPLCNFLLKSRPAFHLKLSAIAVVVTVVQIAMAAPKHLIIDTDLHSDVE
jgi:hypothetical protein